MSSSDTDWKAILSPLNSILQGKERWRDRLDQRALSTGWCGVTAATESEIAEVEVRLGTTLPPSYRSFLLTSNGWYPFNDLIQRLLPVQELERLRKADPEALVMIEENYQEDDLPDRDYFDYETPRKVEALRLRYYPESLLVGKGWDGGGGELILLNPHVVSDEGEWEAIFFAHWIPGNRRYRSFRGLIERYATLTE